jgi:hypothetical protein
MFKRGRQVINASSKMVRSSAKVALKTLVYNTKVDTGEARSNWRVGVGNPTKSVIRPYVPYPKRSKGNGQGISETSNARATIDAGNARIDSLRGVSGAGLKTSLYISNNSDHIDVALLGGTMEVVSAQVSANLRNFRIFTDNEDEGGDI